MTTRELALALLAGAAAGGFAAAFLMHAFGAPERSAPRSAPGGAPATFVPMIAAAPESQDEPRLAPQPSERAPAAVTESPERAPAGDALAPALFSPALLEYAREALQRGWGSERPDQMPEDVFEAALEQFRDEALALPETIGTGLARQATALEEALEDARTGGVFALLARLDEGAGPVLSLVRDDARFEALFRADAEGSFFNGVSLVASEEPAPDGTTMTFPAGVFRIPDFTRSWSRNQPLPRDLTVAGAGMNATLLVLETDLSVASRIRNLRFRDLTVYTDGACLFDVRIDGTVVRLDRVRVSGFDSGAGGSSAFNTDTLALHCVDSILTGGYGRSPSSGYLFDVRTDGLVARFDGCTIEAVRLGRIRDGATLVMRACTLRDMLDDPEELAAEHPGVLLDQCSVERLPDDHASGATLKRDLNDLFPGWKEALR